MLSRVVTGTSRCTRVAPESPFLCCTNVALCEVSKLKAKLGILLFLNYTFLFFFSFESLNSCNSVKISCGIKTEQFATECSAQCSSLAWYSICGSDNSNGCDRARHSVQSSSTRPELSMPFLSATRASSGYIDCRLCHHHGIVFIHFLSRQHRHAKGVVYRDDPTKSRRSATKTSSCL